MHQRLSGPAMTQKRDYEGVLLSLCGPEESENEKPDQSAGADQSEQTGLHNMKITPIALWQHKAKLKTISITRPK